MFCCCGHFNNPFMNNMFMANMLMSNMFMPNMFMSNMFMPNYSPNFFMPNMFNTFMNPMFTNPMFTNPMLSPSIFNFYQNNNISFNTPPLISDTTPHIKHTPQQIQTTKSKDTTKKTNQPKTQKVSKGAKELGPEFLARVKQIAKNLNCDYKDLLGVMNAESGLNSKAVNPNGGATGLIQFMPATAKGLGTTTEKLKNMSPLEQLDYVEKYLIKNKNAAGFKSNQKLNAGDLYALVFLPGRAKREVLTDSSEKYYKYNKGLDLNKDGKITKNELAQKVQNRHVNESIFA